MDFGSVREARRTVSSRLEALRLQNPGRPGAAHLPPGVRRAAVHARARPAFRAPGHQAAQRARARGGGGGGGGARPGEGAVEAVLMDFGSVREARRTVSSRLEALRLQEEAEAHCTAAYRAPELFDVPSECTVDEKVDIWSLGCCLYYLLRGESPFEYAL